MPLLAAFCLVLLLGACGSVAWQTPSPPEQRSPDAAYTQSPDPTLTLPPVKAAALVGAVGYAASLYRGPAEYLNFAAAAAVVAYVVYDPLAPNWTVEERLLDPDTYHLSMRAKSFRTGGDGESGLILHRRAMQLQRARGFSSYRILEYSEGVESSTPFTHRYAAGVIQLVRAEPVRTP
ncbi:MAG: hypothetical protein V5B32_08315 [Candidatus Accumulibacter sp. UW26]|jgi:hypothetical protein